MPKGDRTGPTGMGAKTGRAAGFCSRSETAGYESLAGERRNIGGGRRGRRGVGNNQQMFGRRRFNAQK